MVIWILLFLVILIISFFLALRSMGDFQEPVNKSDQPLNVYLVQNPDGLSHDILKSLFDAASLNHQFISFERLYKGSRSALVITGPGRLISDYQEPLDLLELEDYSQKIDTQSINSVDTHIASWEVGEKRSGDIAKISNFSSYMPKLADNDEFWWQVVAVPSQSVTSLKNEVLSVFSSLTGGRLNIDPKDQDVASEEMRLKIVIRAVLISSTPQSLQALKDELFKIGHNEGLSALPQVYSSNDLIDMYQNRTLPLGKLMNLNLKKQTGQSGLEVNAEQLISLIGVAD